MRIEKSNALEDTILKYDFKIVLNRRRGIALEAEDVPRDKFAENKRRIGIQFTVREDPSEKAAAILKAKERISEYEKAVKHKVDDILILKMPILKTFSDLYKKWRQQGKPSGGPEQYWSREQKLEIFKQATRGLLDLSEEELQKLKI